MELAVVSNGWGIKGFVCLTVTLSDCACVRVRVCVAYVNQICEFLLLNLAITCSFLSRLNPISWKPPTP